MKITFKTTPNLSLKDYFQFRSKVFKESIPASVNGSISLEASLVIPIFIFYLMTILLSIEMIRLQTNVFEALHQGLSLSFADQSDYRLISAIFEYMDGRDNPYLCLRNSKEGLIITNNSSIDSNGEIRVSAKYEIRPFINTIPLKLIIEDEVVGHSFTGYVDSFSRDGEADKDEYVYITLHGSKYHRNPECTYIRITPQALNYTDLDKIRNESGGRYYPCEVCRPNTTGLVFVTKNGSRYHGSSNCTELTRVVMIINLKEALERGYTGCSKCG